VLGEFLAACDHSRLVVRREPHRLRLVELGVLKCCQPGVAGSAWRVGDPSFPRKPDSRERPERSWAAALRLAAPSFAGGWQGPRVLCSLIVHDAHPDSDQVAFALSLRNDLLRDVGRHSSNRREKLPLVGVRAEIGVNEHAVPPYAAQTAREVQSSSLGHRVLVGKKRS